MTTPNFIQTNHQPVILKTPHPRWYYTSGVIPEWEYTVCLLYKTGGVRVDSVQMLTDLPIDDLD